MKILFITAEGFDTPNANNQMAETMINGFLDKGYSVHLIQSRRQNINPDLPDSLRSRSGFSSDTIKRKVVDKTSFVRRYINDVYYAFQSMKYWKKVADVDVIYLQSNPTIVLPIFLLKIFKRKPIVYSIYDVFPGHAYSVGVVKSRLLYRLMQIVQKPCYKWANIISVLEDDMKRKVMEQGAPAEKVRVVPAWYDVSSAKEIDRYHNRFIEKYQIDSSKFYVQFAGTVGYVFRYETVIELAQRIKDVPDIIIQIVGDGTTKSEFEKRVSELQLENIKFYPLQPVDLVPDVYSTCDICLIPLKEGVIGNGIPSKAPILMACHRVIVNSVEVDSEYAKMFATNDMGVSVDIADPDSLAEAVIDLYHNPQRLSTMADNAQRFGREHYSSTMSIQKYCDIFEELVK